MNFPINAILLDVVFIVFTIIMLVIGYIKGFVVRLYDFLATIFALLLSLFLSGPLNDIFHLYTTDGVMMFVAPFVNRIFIFMLLFSVFRIIFFILGRFIKPGLKEVVTKISFIDHFDRLLGIVLSFIEVICIGYLVLLISVSPVFNNGKTIVNETILAKQVLKIAPSLSNQVMEMTDDFQAVKEMVDQGVNYEYTSPESISLMVSLLSGIQDFNMIPQSDMDDLITAYIDTLNRSQEPITIDKETYASLQELIKQMDTSTIDIEKVFEKINVSE